VTDTPRQVSCPEINTIGNQDNYLDPNETITCTASYNVTDTDVSTGSVTSLATANVGGVASNQSGVTLTKAAPTPVLTLTKTASSQTYGQVGQTITYNYTITNTGTTSLGPAQFVITDNKLGAPLPCGPADATIAPSQSLTCSAPYLITQADMAAPNVTNSATASGAGQTSPPATTTINNLSAAAATQTANAALTATIAPAPSNLSPGSTIQHQVAVGEWLIQIGRCYGATYDDMRNANPQIADPDFILPSMVVTVPRIGSAGRIYGPPCITFYTVQSGDTWASIAQRYNADIVVLQKVNPVTLAAGTSIKIPLNSAGSLPASTPATVATATATTSAAAQRITFNAGETTTSRVGIVNLNETIRYLLSAAPGQVLTISLTGPANTEVTLGVTSPTGLVLKPPDGNFTWTTSVIDGGDYTISIASIAGTSQKAYTLTISLTSAATATLTPTIGPTATNTSAPGSP
jgi:LysM repeat protein